MGAHILIADDDRRQADLVRRYLEHDGHAVVVTHDGRAALDEARRRLPDLLVLDVMLPRLDGLEVCRAVRAAADVPVVMLTARTTEDDVLAGLDVGADDYVRKPYSPRELTARVRAVLRRSGRDALEQPYRVADLVVDPVRHEVRLVDRLVDVTASEFKVLHSLIAAPGRAFTRRGLLEDAFGLDHFVQERTIDVHIRNLRHKIEDDPADPRYVLTVYGVGYRMTSPADSSRRSNDET